MGSRDQRRVLALWGGLCLFGGGALAQSRLPPTAPTALGPPAAASAPTELPAAPASAPEHPAQVGYQAGRLTVIAENSSLNQILREVAHQTGMKITGGVTDQRVYGTYGPASPSVVLGRLLEGSGANMMLRMTAANQPTELVLTPMQGRPTPPSLDTRAAVPQQPSIQTPQPVYPGGQQPGFVPAQGFAPPAARPQYVTQPSSPPAASAAPPPAAQPVSPAVTFTPQSPNGVLTPQQIYEQLQRLQQQKAQPATGAQ